MLTGVLVVVAVAVGVFMALALAGWRTQHLSAINNVAIRIEAYFIILVFESFYLNHCMMSDT